MPDGPAKKPGARRSICRCLPPDTTWHKVKSRRPIKVGIKGRGRSGRSRDSNPACQCRSSAHLVQCEPDEASGFTNPNVGPGTYASLRLKLDAWSSAVQRGQKCSSPTRRLPSRSWGPIRPRVCSWFRAPIRHECQTAQLKSRGARRLSVEKGLLIFRRCCDTQLQPRGYKILW